MDHEEWAPAAFQQAAADQASVRSPAAATDSSQWKSHVDPVNIDPDSCGIYEEESDQAQGAPSLLARDFQTMLSNGFTVLSRMSAAPNNTINYSSTAHATTQALYGFRTHETFDLL